MIRRDLQLILAGAALILLAVGCQQSQEEELLEEEVALEEEQTTEEEEEESTTESQTTRVVAREKETVVQPSPPPPSATEQPVRSEPQAVSGPCGISTDWQQGQVDWMNSSAEEKAAIRECHIAQREAGTGPVVTHESAESLPPADNPAAEHARQSQAANKGQGEGANMCGIAPDATWYGQPC